MRVRHTEIAPFRQVSASKKFMDELRQHLAAHDATLFVSCPPNMRRFRNTDSVISCWTYCMRVRHTKTAPFRQVSASKKFMDELRQHLAAHDATVADKTTTFDADAGIGLKDDDVIHPREGERERERGREG